MSETAQSRSNLIQYCQGMGLDIGYGGDPISPTAITIDLERPYASAGGAPQHLKGNGGNLYWFMSNVFDYVYSSHLIEDFPPEEMIHVLQEWLRVIKPGGNLVLVFPDERVYLKYCEQTGQDYNQAHRNHDLSLAWFHRHVLMRFNGQIGYYHVQEIYSKFPVGVYGVELVLKKNC